MRGFSTIELLVAFTITVSALLSVVVTLFGIEPTLKNSELEQGAYAKASEVLSKIQAQSVSNFPEKLAISTSSDEIYTTEISYAYVDEDDLILEAQVRVAWHDVRATQKEIIEKSIIANTKNSERSTSCDPFPSGDWNNPLTVNHHSLVRGDLLSNSVPVDTYPISDMAISKSILAVSVANTGLISSPTLFFLSLSQGTAPILLSGGFDNATSSTVGFSAVTASGSYVYGANGFGSASSVTCSTGINCSQLQIFSIPPTETPIRVGSLFLSTSSAPYAVTSSGSSAAAHAIAYKNNYVYLGLQKTIAGSEFNIIDVTDKAHPVWKGGVRIGRTINNIQIYRGRAYIATDDNTKELAIVNIEDPTNPVLIGGWNAPGGTGFGFGTYVRVLGERAYLGRSYVNNAPELYAINVKDPSVSFPTDSVDTGTPLFPRSVSGILLRTFLTFVLTNKSLSIFTNSATTAFSKYRDDVPLQSGANATALTCNGNILYVGGSDGSASNSFIQTITTL